MNFREGITLSLLILFTFSLINQGFLGYKGASAQVISPFSPIPSNPVVSAAASCKALSVSRITASGSQSDLPPANAIDGKPDTRWSNLGLGSSITLDLGTEKSLCSVDISWYRGNERKNIFTISVSDGKSFTDVFSGSSSGMTTDFETYNFPDTSARYVRITVTGNTQNDWVSISEIRVFGDVITPSSSCNNNLPVSAITASGSQSPNIPSNAIDNNIATRWSNEGLGSWIRLGLGTQKTICSVDISWYNGNQRVNTFDIAVSNDSTTFTTVFSGKSNGTTTTAEKYDVTDTQGRYVKITVNGNTQNDWVSISEIRVFGDVITPFPPPSDNTLNIAAAGDWGCSSQAQKTLQNMRQKTPEVILALGDLSYKSSPNCWFDLISPIEGIMNVVMGNHDEDEGNPPSLASAYRQKFGLGTSYYSFNYRNIHFVMMNSEIAFELNSPQYSFVNHDLAVASGDAAIKWIIVSFHTPMYTSPSKHAPNVLFRETYHPLFDKYDVDLVLQAHNHNYQRSYPLSFNGLKSTNPKEASSEKNDYTDTPGQIYAVVGTAGKSLYALNSKASFNADQFEAYGFLNLEISDDGNIMTGRFYSAEDNSIKDQFTIAK